MQMYGPTSDDDEAEPGPNAGDGNNADEQPGHASEEGDAGDDGEEA